MIWYMSLERVCMYIYIYIWSIQHIAVVIGQDMMYIYIYIERDREREREPPSFLNHLVLKDGIHLKVQRFGLHTPDNRVSFLRVCLFY